MTNEAQTLTVTGTTTGIITLNAAGGAGGGSTTIAGSGINTVAQSAGTITITGTEVDGSVTNEAQTLTVTGTTTGIITLNAAGGAGGGSTTIAGSGINTVAQSAGTITITATEVDGSVTNEAQTLTVTGTTTGVITLNAAGGAGGGSTTIAGAGTNTVAQSGGTITITGTGGPGSGTVGYHPKWATSSTLSSTSFIYDRGNSIVLNGTTSGGLFTIKGLGSGAKDIYMGNGELKLQGPGATHWSMRTSEGGISGLYWSDTSTGDTIGIAGTNKMKLDATDGLSIVSNFKLGTYKGTAATSLTGRDGSGYLTNIPLASGLSLVSGTLTPSDNSATNEAQTLSITGATNPTVTLSDAGGAGGGSFQLANGSGIAITQTAGVATIAYTGTATAWINGGNSFGGTPSIGTNDNVPLLFETNGAEKARITQAGALQIGINSAAAARLEVSGITNTVGILAAGGSVATGTALMRATGTIATGYGYVFDGDASNSGGNIIGRVRNSSNTASSNAIHQIAVSGTSAADPFTQYQVEGANTWSVGVSNANADKFCITPDVFPAQKAIGFQMLTTGESGFSSSPSANHSAIWGLAKPLGLPSGTSTGRAFGTNSAIWYNSTILGTEIFCSSHNIYKRITSNGTPTINITSNAGTGATGVLSSGSNDVAGQITFTVGSSGILAGDQLEVQFAGSFSGQVFVNLQARNTAFAQQLTNFFVGTQNTGSFFLTTTTALGAGSVHIFNYRITQ